jgi:hypothetical protein
MGWIRLWAWVGLVCFFCVAGMQAQQDQPAVSGSSNGAGAVAAVPRLMKYSGEVRDARGEPLGSVAVRLSFAVYEEQTGGAALWAEAQTVQLDEQGQYSVLLGATRSDGLPVELFPAGKARWLGVQVEGRDEDPRVLLVSVPYAFKSEDAARLGGRRASDFVLAEQLKEEVRTQVEAQKPATQSVETLVSNPATMPAIAEGPSTFTCATTGDCVAVTQSGTGRALRATATSANEAALLQQNGTGYGLRVLSQSNYAIYGVVQGAVVGTTYGVRGLVNSTTGAGILGSNTAATGIAYGLMGQTSSVSGMGLYGRALSTTGTTVGLTGDADSTSGKGIMGRATAGTGTTMGIYGEARSAGGTALVVNNTASGKLLSGQAGGVEKLSVDGSGNVSTMGKGTFTAIPAGQAVGEGTLYLNPASATLNYTLLGLAVGGTEKFRVDAEGDVYGRGGVFGGAVEFGLVGTGSSSGASVGVRGASDSTGGTAVRGDAGAATGQTFGVHGVDSADDGTGVFGVNNSSASVAGIYQIGPHGVRGEATNSSIGIGVYGRGGGIGVRGEVRSDAAVAAVFDKLVGSFTPSGDIIVARWGTFGISVQNVFRVDATGTVFADGSYNCGLGSGCFNTGVGADVAERIDVTEKLEPGDVVEIDPDDAGRFRKVRNANSTLVAGVVSTAPSITLANNDLKDNDTSVRKDQRPLLALVGRVPLKVTDEGGPVRVGDLLTSSSTRGYAMRCRDRQLCAGAVVGKALQPLPAGTGIQVLVTLQ